MASKKPRPTNAFGAGVRGEVVLRPLAQVKPNKWNPNRMTTHQMDSLVHGLRTDGWLASQSLLVWGTDDKGVAQNVIIDGEHRYRAAGIVGIVSGPMVFLDGLSEAQAKALTIKMNQKRGDFDDAALESLVRELVGDLTTLDGVDLELGFDPTELAKMAGIAGDEAIRATAPAGVPSSNTSADGASGLRVPMTFYVPSERVEYFRTPFAKSGTEALNVSVLDDMIRVWNAGGSGI